MVSDAQKRATNKYNKEKTKLLSVRFCPTDMYILDYIKSQDNIAQYIKGLVISDMNKKEG